MVSKCHWITSGVIGRARNSGSVAAADRLALRADLEGVEIALDPTAVGDRQQLGPEAHAERGNRCGHCGAQQRLDGGDPGEQRVVVDTHLPAQHDDRVPAGRVGAHLGGRHHMQIGAGLGEPFAEPAGRIARRALHDEDPGGAHACRL
jgi:hypothetical protein